MLSINKLAYNLTKKLVEKPEYYRVKIETLPSGAIVIDTGIKAHGGYEAGLMVTRIAMGGAGTAELGYADFDGIKLPTVNVSTDHPAIALFGAQLAGWRIKPEGYTADGSGPARALALKPKNVFKKIEYQDESDVAVLLMEAEELPPDSAAYYISERANVKPENVVMVMTTTTSVAGMVQISGRIVETGLFRLDQLGLDPKKILYGVGYAPVMPVHTDGGVAMGRAEDALTYGGVTSFIVDEEESVLEEIAEKAPSNNCKDYGKTSYEIYKTGKTFASGKINNKIIKQSIFS